MSHSTRRARLAHLPTARLAAAGLAAVAALTLTACGGGEDNAVKPIDDTAKGTASQDVAAENTSARNAGPKESAAGSADGPAAGSADGTTGKGAPKGAASQGDSAARAPRDGDGSADRACAPSQVRITAKRVSRPINHMLLEVTNTSGTRCNAYGYPFLRFDDAQAPTAVDEDSQPQAVVSLDPGATGYAGVMTSAADGSGGKGFKATSLQVLLSNKEQNGSVGNPVQVALPGGSVHIDDAARVTYWQSTIDLALN